MKIALYVPSWPPGASPNGIVTYAAQMVPALRDLGHEVFVLTRDCKAEIADIYTVDLSKIEVRRSILTRLKARLFTNQAVFKSSIETLLTAIVTLKEQHDIDIIEIEESFGWSFGIAQANLIPLVVRLHGPWFLNGVFDEHHSLSYRRRVILEGRGIGAAAMITAPSANVLSHVRTYYNLELELARVIPNPIGINPNSACWQLANCDTNRILFVGRFDRRKGGDIVLHAFASLARVYPELRLTFVGPDLGIRENGTLLLFDQYIHKNLPSFCWSRIQFCGELSHKDVMSLRNEHLFTIVASQFEILPYSVMEAMSLGCPVIASSVGGIGELIIDQRNGLLFHNQDIKGLVEACQRLLDSHDLAAEIGARAREDCRKLLDPKVIATQTVGAYQAAISLAQDFRGGMKA